MLAQESDLDWLADERIESHYIQSGIAINPCRYAPCWIPRAREKEAAKLRERPGVVT